MSVAIVMVCSSFTASVPDSLSARRRLYRPRGAGRTRSSGHDFLEVARELPGAGFPGLRQGECTAGLARYLQGPQARGAKIFAEHADRMIPNHIFGAGPRKGGPP